MPPACACARPSGDSARFYSSGLLAIAPEAFGQAYALPAPTPPPPFLMLGSVAVVDIAGPLTHCGPFDFYDAIVARVRAALASDARSVVMRCNSPGGEVYGAFDAARALRAAADAAKKPLIAFTSAAMQSACYALAVAADSISASAAAGVGSIGVIATHVETTAADKAAGLSFTIVASGDRKGDGNPHQKLSDAALSGMQASIDRTAKIFFELVKERRGFDASKFEGRSWLGVEAVAPGVIDRVESWDELIARLEGGLSDVSPGAMLEAAPSMGALSSAASSQYMDPSEEKKAKRAALAKAAAEAAKALADFDGPDKKDDDDADKKKSKAADDAPDKKDDEKKDAKAKAAAESAAPSASTPAAPAADPLVAGLMAQVRAQGEQLAAIARANADAERAKFMATRPDLTKELVAALAEKPLDEVKAIVNAIPNAGNPLAPTFGNPALSGAPSTPLGEVGEILNHAFGRGGYATPIHAEGRAVTFHPMSREQARTRLAEIKK